MRSLHSPYFQRSYRRCHVSTVLRDAISSRLSRFNNGFIRQNYTCLEPRNGSGTPLLKRRLRGHTRAVCTLQFDEVKLITGSMDSTLKVWDWHRGKCIKTL